MYVSKNEEWFVDKGFVKDLSRSEVIFNIFLKYIYF
jgi:hypothetical protein